MTAALSVAGAMGDDGAFVFAGFLPAKTGERDAAVARLAQEARTVVLLEAPHRIELLAHSLAALGPRTVTVARELTKQFEEIATLPCAQLPAWLAADAQRTRGEFALVLHAVAAAPKADDGLRVLKLLLQELPRQERRQAGRGDHWRLAQRAVPGGARAQGRGGRSRSALTGRADRSRRPHRDRGQHGAAEQVDHRDRSREGVAGHQAAVARAHEMRQQPAAAGAKGRRLGAFLAAPQRQDPRDVARTLAPLAARPSQTMTEAAGPNALAGSKLMAVP